MVVFFELSKTRFVILQWLMLSHVCKYMAFFLINRWLMEKKIICAEDVSLFSVQNEDEAVLSRTAVQ